MDHHLPFGKIALSGNWTNCTTYQFVSDSEVGLEAPLAAGQQVAHPRSSVVVARINIEGQTPGEWLDGQLSQQARNVPGFSTKRTEPWSHPRYGLLETRASVMPVTPVTVAYQTQLFIPTANPGEYVMLTFSCDHRLRADAEPVFRAALASFELSADAAPDMQSSI